jgi:hypothetical protein
MFEDDMTSAESELINKICITFDSIDDVKQQEFKDGSKAEAFITVTVKGTDYTGSPNVVEYRPALKKIKDDSADFRGHSITIGMNDGKYLKEVSGNGNIRADLLQALKNYFVDVKRKGISPASNDLMVNIRY